MKKLLFSLILVTGCTAAPFQPEAVERALQQPSYSVIQTTVEDHDPRGGKTSRKSVTIVYPAFNEKELKDIKRQGLEVENYPK